MCVSVCVCVFVYVSGSGTQLFSTHIRGPGGSSVRNFPKFVLGTDTDDVPPGARCYSLEFSVSTMQLITVFFLFLLMLVCRHSLCSTNNDCCKNWRTNYNSSDLGAPLKPSSSFVLTFFLRFSIPLSVFFCCCCVCKCLPWFPLLLAQAVGIHQKFSHNRSLSLSRSHLAFPFSAIPLKTLEKSQNLTTEKIELEKYLLAYTRTRCCFFL